MAQNSRKEGWVAEMEQRGIRPTRQRLALGRLLFGDGMDRHVTPEGLYEEARARGYDMALATVYNTLHSFAEAGLLHPLKVAPGRQWYDTRTDEHHHFYYIEEERLEDIAPERIGFAKLPEPPQGMRSDGIDVIIRVTKSY